MTENSTMGGEGTASVQATLTVGQERRLIRPRGGSLRHVAWSVRIASAPRPANVQRPPLALSLVLDRSGSMHGEKIETAKRATLTVLDHLEPRDRVAVVVFDDRIDLLQDAAPATGEVKARIRAELAGVEARGNTALHEGWLTGCRAIASDRYDADVLARCFLLTDGQANAGVTDPEQIASEAAGIREHARVGTSTFGIGDYDESLLGPLAVAGGGQFHNLRGAEEMARAFVGELGELTAVVARIARLEIEAAPGGSVEMVSPFLLSPGGRTDQWIVALGDLLGGDERQVVVRLGFPSFAGEQQRRVRARLLWLGMDGQEHVEPWQEVRFSYAEHAARYAETVDRATQRIVGLQHADRALRKAGILSRQGAYAESRSLLTVVANRIAAYAGDDPDLLAACKSLLMANHEVAEVGYDTYAAKERYAASQARSRGQRDLR